MEEIRMKKKLLLVVIATLFAVTACGKTEKFSLKEPRPTPSVSASAQPIPTPATSASASPSPTPTPTAKNDNNIEITYVGNKSSKIFHLPACHTLPDKKNRVNLYSRETAIHENYKPCKNCKP